MPTRDLDWPYAPLWFDTPDGRLHYVDEGPRGGSPVVLVHGNPSWGYLYRRFIGPLATAGHRVIVPDLLGFGRSDAPRSAAARTVERHASRLAGLLDALDLHDATLAVHDWGGPIGLAWAASHPERVQRLVLFNTFLHRPLGAVRLPLPLKLFRAPGVGALLVQGLDALVRGFLLGAGVARRERLTPAVRAAYLSPRPRVATRAAMLALARAFPATPDDAVADFQADVHARLGVFAARPVLIVWAGRDVVFDRATLDRWRGDLPRAELLELPEAGHFVQEDAHEEIIPVLLDFLRRSAARDPSLTCA